MLAVAVQEAPGHVKPKVVIRYETKAPQRSTGYRRDHFLSLVFLPLLTGIGHLAPSIGAARAMLGQWYLDWPVLVATSTITAFIDGYDKYRDIPKAERPSKLALTAWLVPLLGSTLVASILCGLDTAWSLHRWLIFGFVYGNPLIPTYSFKTGRVTFIKPKVVFAMAKSALVAIVMSYVDADVGASHACKVHDWQCAGVGGSIYWRAWAVSFAYNWVRETMCDVRDIDEDRDEGVPTLPVTIGRRWTVALLVSVTFCIEQTVFQGQLLAVPELDSVARQFIAFVGCLLIANRPREAKWTWSFVALCGLLPATWGQASLVA